MLKAEVVTQRCSVKKVFLEISQSSQENTCARVSLRCATLPEKRLWHRCFLVGFEKFLRTPFLKEHLWATASVKVRFILFKLEVL